MKKWRSFNHMKVCIRDFVGWFFGRSSNSAMLVLIDIAEDFNERDIQQAANYLVSLKQCRQARKQSGTQQTTI